MANGSVVSRITTVVAMLIILPLASGILIFPVYLLLQRDIQLHGKQVTGRIVEHKLKQYKSGTPLHWYRVQFQADTATVKAWIDTGSRRITSGTLEVIYAPIFPGFARFAGQGADPWNQNLLVRVMAVCFISGWAIVMMIGFYQRLVKRSLPE
jgi:hypothetical protein